MKEAMSGARASNLVAAVPGLLTPRMERLMALLASREWTTREDVDRLVGVSNGPGIVRDLRGVLGFGAVEMQTIKVVDRDGSVCRPGRYRLTDAGRTAAVGLGLLLE
jgi:hypothetical protein